MHKINRTRVHVLFVWLSLTVISLPVIAQKDEDSSIGKKGLSKESAYITRLDTLLHLQSWVSANKMEYTLVYNKDFKLLLAPNNTNNLSFGFSYRYLDLGVSFSPAFINQQQKDEKKGSSEQFSFGTGFSMHRFKFNFDLSNVKGFYLKNSQDFTRAALPDSPYLLFPTLGVRYVSLLVRYNLNPNFSTAALTSGTQVQNRSALTVLPCLQLSNYRFNDDSKSSGVQNENTYSTDLNLIVPVAGTLVLSPKFSTSLGLGPSLGVDFFKSVALNDSNKVELSKGTKLTTGYSLQTSIGYHSKRFFGGFELQYRGCGHKIEDISRLKKEYSYFQVFIGYRLNAPGFARKSLDWVNKVSPIGLE
ncbi:MAG: DUF4421 family protein [Flavisolibacter sp.]